MDQYDIYTLHTKNLLFSVRAPSFKHCLERAVSEGVDLTGADLKKQNLSNANLDDAQLAGASFKGCNLSGANLSEADLRGPDFRHTGLYNTCFNSSDLSGGNFEDADFGGTDIAGARLSKARFSTLSCFSLPFASAKSLEGCSFRTLEEGSYGFSQPPVVILGLCALPIVTLDSVILHGHKISARIAF